MENKTNISELIDYLYGDLTQLEKENFEEKLRTNPELRRDLEELTNARKGLSSIGDREVMDPFVFQAGYSNSVWNKTVNRPRFMIVRYFVAIAASFTLFLVAGYLTKTTIRLGNGITLLSFADSAEPEKALTREEIKDLIQKEVENKNEALISLVKASESSFQRMLDDHNLKRSAEIRKLFTAYSNAKNEEIDVFLSRLRKDNRDIIDEYVAQAGTQQQLYVQHLLTSFSDYLREQRTQDLQRIQNSLVTLKESQDQQKLQTSEILTSIITTMNTQNN